MLNECLGLIGDGAFLKEYTPKKQSRLEIYNEIQIRAYMYAISAGMSDDKARRYSNIYAVKNTDKEFYRRLRK